MVDYRLTTSTPGLGAAPSPTSAVGQYVNQQLASLQATGAAKESAQRQEVEQSPLSQNQASTVQTEQENPLTQVAQSVRTSNEQLQKIENEANQNRQMQQSQVSSGLQGSPEMYTYQTPTNVTGTRAQALNEASRYLGTRYQLGGTTQQGIDCSGLVKMVYSKMGYNISRHSATWQRDNIPGVRTNDLSSLRPGDLVAWKDGSHIAIYAGNGEIIEAANKRVGTVRRKLWANPGAVTGIKLQFPGE